MNELVVVKALPERAGVETLDQLLADAAVMVVDGIGSDLAEAERLVALIDGAISAHGGLLASETLAPVSKPEIVGFVTRLDMAFRAKSPPEFIGMMAEDIADERPSSGALRVTENTLRKMAKFMPSIAEVIEILRSEAAKERGARRAIERLPEHAATIRKMIADRRPRPHAAE